MRILFISYYYGFAASGVISKRVAEQLFSSGNELIVITNTPSIELKGERSNFRIIHLVSNIEKWRWVAKVYQRVSHSNFIYFYDRIWVNKSVRVAKKIIERWRPDCIYCRTSPVEACYVGERLHSLFNIPVLQHFSDPVPAPIEYLPESRNRRVLKKRIKEVIVDANLVSFGNKWMMQYVQKELNMSLVHKAFISPDMASSSIIHYSPQVFHKDKTVLTYLGNIYGGRNPNNLFYAISNLRNNGVNIEMRVYSSLPSVVREQFPFVVCMNYTDDIQKALEEANILVDLDGDDKEPVFISSKLKDYLLINRPILSITPDNSPSRMLLNNLATVSVVHNEIDDIKLAINNILSTQLLDSDYKEREEIIDCFGPERVSADIIQQLTSLSKRNAEA